MHILISLIFIYYCISGSGSYELSNDPNDVKYIFHSSSYPILRVSNELILGRNETVDPSCSRFKETVVLIHGFWSNVEDDMPKLLVQSFLKVSPKSTPNLIVVDWEKLANTKRRTDDEKFAAYLEVVTKNIPIVAEKTAKLLIWLGNLGHINLSRVHIIGHSLGAHTSGMVGSLVGNMTGTHKIRRISGLDPAGPGFEYSTGFPLFRNYQRKLNQGDAEFVDIYHTNMNVKGDTSLDGHVDFYPNGGIKQPGCPKTDPFGTCEHGIVVNYYAETILGRHYPVCPCKPRKGDPGKECLPNCERRTRVDLDMSPGYFLNEGARGEYYFDTRMNYLWMNMFLL